MSDSSKKLVHPSTMLYRVLAISALGAGSVGLVMPVLPTTPFILVALWATARGAPEWHDRIRTHPRFGPTVDAWQTQRAVPTRAKWLACTCMTASWIGLWLGDAHVVVIGALAVLFISVSAFIIGRPAPASSPFTIPDLDQ